MNMDQSSEDFDSTAFEEVNNILGNENISSPNKQISVLTSKINELQKICITLTNANKRQLDRIQQLQQSEYDNNNNSNHTNFNEQYSEMQNDFTDIQGIIKEYRTSLSKYQLNVSEQLKQKDYTISQITQELRELRFNNQHNIRIIQELQIQNKSLEQGNQSLIVQVEQLQTCFKRMQLQSRRYTKVPSQYKQNFDNDQLSGFNMNVEYELEKLIQKLIKELQYQRTCKRKLSNQIKRLQKDIVSLQQQITLKNNKIYNLQLSALKNIKVSPNPTPAHNMTSTPKKIIFKKQQEKFPTSQKQKQTHPTTSKLPSSFTFMELLNGCTELNIKQKLIIASKTIDLYIKKIHNGDYCCHVLQSLIISNFNPANPNSVSIRVDKAVKYEDLQQEYNQTESQVIWNLAFVLQNLLSQTMHKNEDFGQISQYGIFSLIAKLLQNRQANQLSQIFQLKKLVQQALATNKQ